MGYVNRYELSQKIEKIPKETIKKINEVLKEFKNDLLIFMVTNEEICISDANNLEEEFYFNTSLLKNSCKTNRASHDLPMCIILLILFYELKEINISSDGFWVSESDYNFFMKNNKIKLDGSWNKALSYVKEKFGMEFSFISKIENSYYRFEINRNYEINKKEEFYYLKLTGKISVNINIDGLVKDENNKVYFLSLYDSPAVIDKFMADLCADSKVTIALRKRGDADFFQNLTFPGVYQRYSKIIKRKKHVTLVNKSDKFIAIKDGINLTQDEKATFFNRYVTLKHRIPCEKQIILSNLDSFKPLIFLGHNEELKKLFGDCYLFYKDMFKSRVINEKNDFMPDVQNINEFIIKFQKDTIKNLYNNINPLYDPKKDYGFSDFLVRPKKGQEKLWGSGIETIYRDKVAYLASEMGTGKTIASLLITRSLMKLKGKKAYTVLITAPGITLNCVEGGWKNEIDLIMQDKDQNGNIIKNPYECYILGDSNTARKFMNDVQKKHINLRNPKVPTFICCTKEVAKLSSIKLPSYIKKGNHVLCPDCFHKLKFVNSKGVSHYFTEEDFFTKSGKTSKVKKIRTCEHCGSSIFADFKFDKNKNYQNDLRVKQRRTMKKGKVGLLDFFKKQKLKFNMSIVDEAHEGNKPGSLISRSHALAIKLGKYRMCLSGTSNNGYASNMFNVLRSLVPKKLIEYDVMNINNFCSRFGVFKKSYTKVEDKKSGRGERVVEKLEQIEGLSPELFTSLLAENFIFFKLKHILEGLPEYEEKYIPIEQDWTYHHIKKDFFDVMDKKSKSILAFRKDSIGKHIINNPFNWEEFITVRYKKNPFLEKFEIENINFPKIQEPANYISEKDKVLLQIAKEQKNRGRKFCINTYFNKGESKYQKTQTIGERIFNLLTKNGFKVAMLQSDHILKPNGKKIKTPVLNRERNLNEIKEEIDCFITDPGLINVGLNLKWCPTYINTMPSYMIDIVSQSNRRGYRINSKFKNEVYHLYYKGTLEEDIIDRFQRKKVESQTIEANLDSIIEENKADEIRTYSKDVTALYKSLNGDKYDSAI